MRGEIWTVAGSGYASKPRPALVIQDDKFSATGSIVILLLTTTDIGTAVHRIRIPANANTGLLTESFAQVDKIAAIKRESLGQRIGFAPQSVMAAVNKALTVFLGIK